MTPTAVGHDVPGPLPLGQDVDGRAPKLLRVHDRATQARLRRSRRVRRGPLTLSCVAEPGSRQARVAYAIGRTAGGAVRRNRARRRLRAVMAELAPSLVGRAWLVGAGPEAVDEDFSTLRAYAESAVEALERR